ncbi:MAG: hypothetical protein ABSG25_12115, partial [Bryobacteraceae bacterium]
MFKLASLSVVLLAMTLFVVPAAAGPIGFSGYFAPANWTLGNGGTNGYVTPAAPSSIALYGSHNYGPAGGDYFVIQAPTDGTVSFSWDFEDTPEEGYATFYAMENWNPVWVAGSTGQSGTYSFTINAGDWFGFDVGSIGIYNPYVNISNFDFVSATP